MQFIVVRHSERIDEADKEAWKVQYNELYSQSVPCPVERSKKYYMNDPPITERGVTYATQAGEMVCRLISRAFSSTSPSSTQKRVCVYSSKMKRCVQTAVHVARKIIEGGESGASASPDGVCIHLSSGLSSVIQAVAKARGAFEFLTPAELDSISQDGIAFVDCDLPNTEHSLPCDDYVHTIQAILDRPISSTSPLTIHVLVGHRETIRGLVGVAGGVSYRFPLPSPVPAPYCCIGIFEMHNRNNSAGSSSNSTKDTTKTTSKSLQRASAVGSDKKVFILKLLLSCRGEQIYPPRAPPSTTATTNTTTNATSKHSSSTQTQPQRATQGQTKTSSAPSSLKKK